MNWLADKIEQWPTAKLVPYARNARTHSDAQATQIDWSIAPGTYKDIETGQETEAMVVTAYDNGVGMDADVLRKALLTRGGSVKPEDSVGGFGDAKNLILFPWLGWKVETRDLVALVSGNTESDLYKRFFPEPHEDVIAMGLDSEVPEVTLIVYTLEQNTETPGALKGHLEPLRSSLRLGNGALAARSDALAELGRHQARVEAWNETASSTLKSLRKTLGRIAEARKLPSTWAEAFFVEG